MLEGLVATLLNRFLGMYVKNFDPGQLKVGIWSGDVKLRNLELRREALDQLKLPLNVIEGHVGELTLAIPWSNLRGQPVRVFIENVYLLAAPKEDAEYDEEEEEQRRQAVKIEKLDSAEILKEKTVDTQSPEEAKKSQSFTTSLVETIVNNLQISMRNIHIRYEDAISAPGHPFALGVTLEEFIAVSCDGEWQPKYVSQSSGTTHKLAKLDSLAVYWNTDTTLLGSERDGEEALSHDDMMTKFEEMIAKDAESSSHQFILKPVSGQAKLEMNKVASADKPKIKAGLVFEEIGLVLDDDQYRDALMMVDLFHYFIRHQEYKKFQPKEVTPKEDPRAWLLFAGNAILSKIHDRNRRWSWDYFRERRDDRKRYIELFKKKKKDPNSPTPAEKEELNKLEWKYTYEDLRFFRSIARSQLRKENVGVKKQEAPAQKGWIAWAWGSKSGGAQEAEDESTTMTEEQRQELYDAIDWDEKTAIAESVDLPRDTIKAEVDATLNTGSFTLQRNVAQKRVEVLSFYFDSFKSQLLQRPDSVFADVSLGGLRVNDGTTPETLFPQIVRVKDAPSGRVQELDDDGKPIEDTSAEPLFQLQVEQHPLDESADFAVTAKLKSLELVWNPQVVTEVIKFFKPPERHMDSVAALLETAAASVEGIRQQTRAGLEFALEEHKTINAKLDLRAPLIIVPESVTTKSTNCLIVDAGHISVTSKLVDKETLREIQAKQKQVYSDADYDRLESLMYDKFNLKLEDTQVLIGPSIDATKEQLTNRDDTRPMHIVDRTTIDFLAEICIVPKSPLTKMKLSGHLPVLHASISDVKYKAFMRVLDVAIPKTDEAPPPEKPKPQLTGTAQKRRSRAQSTSFQFTSQQAVILEDDSDDDEGDFQDASDGSGDESLRLKQRQFELKFTVDKLQGSLLRSDPDGKQPDQLLVEVVAQHFELGFWMRPYDMTAEVSLKSFNIDDCISNPSAEFKSLVSSGDGGDEKLVQVRYVKVKRQSPEFMSVFGGVDTSINVDISTINLVVTRMTFLQLLDFILVTFTNNNPQSPAEPSSPDSDDEDAVSMDEARPNPDKMQVKIKLQGIVLVLNNDGIRLATLSLTSADVGIFLMGKTMRIGARLQDMSLLDDINQGASTESALRKLITIEGENLADFQYETFDADSPDNYPGYDSAIKLRTGSIKVNFVEEPFRKIVEFMVKFGRMKTIVDKARQAAANQASQIQESAAKMHFDINMNTPILVFPRVMTTDTPQRDLVTAYLGEIYLKNKFVPLSDSESAPIVMKVNTGIRNIRLTSDFYFPEEQHEELEMIDKVDIDFNITHSEHIDGLKRPDTEIAGTMSDLNLRISQTQLRFLLELSKSVPAAFASDSDALDQDASQDLPEATVSKARTFDRPETEEKSVDLGPEIKPDANTWTKLDFAFTIKTLGLELILAKEDEPIGDLSASSLSKFSLDDPSVKLRMLSNDSLEAELLIHSFSITDSRAKNTNKFRKVMTSTNRDVQQFMASVTISGGKERSLIAMVSVDSPRVIFALDHIFAIQAFVSGALAVEEPPTSEDLEIEEESDEDSVATDENRSKSAISADSAPAKPSTEPESSPMSIAFRVNVVDAQVIMIANPLSSSSEAIVLGTKQVLLSQQHALTLQVSQVGMFLCRMDRFEDNRLRVLDDFSIQLLMDSSKENVTTAHLDIEPLVLRVSLRDILLALQIVQKASELSDVGETPSKPPPKSIASKPTDAGLKRRTASGRGESTIARRGKSHAPTSIKTKPKQPPPSQPAVKAAPKHEELTATLDGIRVVLIGDVHELPILDLCVKNFTLNAEDWSSHLHADTKIDTYINVFNFSKSAWEPLLEPWELGLKVEKSQTPEYLSVELNSGRAMDLTVTSATIALASKSAQFLSGDEDVLSKPRGTEAPYKIRNYTGFDIEVWADIPDQEASKQTKLEDGQECPWEFEDGKKMRESLHSQTDMSFLGVRLEGSGFDAINRIPVSREGETIYGLRPRKDQVLHRLLVEIKLGADNVKYIIFRSPLLVENYTQVPIELGVYDSQEGHLLKIEKIAPGESRPAPVGAAFLKSLLVRPDQGFGYTWSSEVLWWRDLLKRPTRTLTCKSESGDQTPPFYFQMNANFDRTSPATSVYPNMRIRLSAPIELQNLLPYDFKYRIYDKNTKKDWTNFLRKGGMSPVHVVELSHLLLMSIDMQDTVFKPSEFAIINSSNHDDFRRENTLVCKDEAGLPLNLKLHYYRIPDSGGAFCVTVYSPYVILNKTGLDISIKSKSLLQQAKAAAGQSFDTNSAEGERRKAQPYMFSYNSDDQRNRALLKVGQSNWSKPQSFDAIGSTVEVVLPSQDAKSEIHVGITVEPGEGKYKLSKVVTLAPRFVLKNHTKEDLHVREPGASEIVNLKPKSLEALHFLQKTSMKQLCLCFPGLNNKWSAPFNISDLGTTHIKLAKDGQRQKLIRVEILMEDATIFLHLSYETNNWPYSMRNESDTEFMFYQANPNVDDDEMEDRSGWRPVRYRLPPRSIMPYAWDYPAAKQKELVISANGKERHVRLAEIGNLIPMKIPVNPNTREHKVIDLNVAADGPMQTLILSNYQASKSMYKQKSRTDSSVSVAGGFEVKDQDTNQTFKAQLNLAGIGISLVNAQLKELAYITFRDVQVKYNESALYQTFSTSVKWIQIDNQLYGGIFPMILYPSVVPKNTKETESHPSVHFMVTRVRDDSYGVLYIKYATVLLQQMTLEIDEDFVYAVLDFSKVPGASWAETHEGKLCDESLDIPEPKQEQGGQDIYFELLNIQPMQLDISFVRTERVNVEDKTSSRNPLMFFFNVLTMAMGNINDAPLRLNALILENARVSSAVLVQNISNHYAQEVLYQMHKILGSADFLGNPVGLFNNISSGVADIFYEPYQGLIMSPDRPEQLGVGLAKGATSFVKKSVFGVSDSISKVTGSISKGLAAATMDKQFQDRRRMQRSRNRPKHALYGVTQGANSFVTSIADGVGGLARKPLEGAEAEGAIGFFKGVGKGMIGLATKPAIGVFDLASNVSEGIKNTTTVFDDNGLDRVRLTRFIGRDGVVRPYNQREALGQFWLKQLDSGKFFKEEYLAHLELPREDVVIMVTYSRIMMIKSKKLATEWDVPLKEVQKISKERTGLSLILRGGSGGPFIPVAEESSRNFLYQKIAVAVNEFNKKYRATE